MIFVGIAIGAVSFLIVAFAYSVGKTAARNERKEIARQSEVGPVVLPATVCCTYCDDAIVVRSMRCEDCTALDAVAGSA